MSFLILCFPMMGLHPCYVKEDYKAQLKEFKQYHDSDRKYYGVGEIGLDYYWDLTFKKEQKDAFETQINWGIELNQPIIIHSRDSLDDTIDHGRAKPDWFIKWDFSLF